MAISGQTRQDIERGLHHLRRWIDECLVAAGHDSGLADAHRSQHQHRTPDRYAGLVELVARRAQPGVRTGPALRVSRDWETDAVMRTWADQAAHTAAVADVVAECSGAVILWAREMRDMDAVALDRTAPGENRQAARRRLAVLRHVGTYDLAVPIWRPYLAAVRELGDVPYGEGAGLTRAVLLDRWEADCAGRHADVVGGGGDLQTIWDVPVHALQERTLRAIALVRREGRLRLGRAVTVADLRTAYAAALASLGAVTIHGAPLFYAGTATPITALSAAWTYDATAQTQATVATVQALNPATVAGVDYEQSVSRIHPAFERLAGTAGFEAEFRVRTSLPLAGAGEAVVTYTGAAAPPADWSVVLTARSALAPARLTIRPAPPPAADD